MGSLLVTFLLGAVIGGAIVYGVIGGAREETPPPLTAAETPVPSEATETPAPPGEEPVPAAVEVEPGASPLRGARFLFVSTPGTALSDDSREFLADFQPGGIVLLDSNIENRPQTIAFVDAIKEAAGMGTGRPDLPLVAVEQEGGPINPLRLQEAPSAAEMGDAAEVAAGYAQAFQARGIAVNLAPVLDLHTPDGPPAFDGRAFSDDRILVAEGGIAFARALMDGGVLPVVKHYPGHGAASGDSRDGPAILDQALEELAYTMYPFAEAAAHGLPGIMAGHLTVTELDPDAPASLSRRLLGQVLRDSWGYEGVILSDDLAKQAIAGSYALEEAAVLALQAGCDALVITGVDFDTLRRVADAIEEAVARGDLDEASLKRSQRRLEGWQDWLRDADAAIGEPLPLPPDDAGETVEENIEEVFEALVEEEPEPEVLEEEPEENPEEDPEAIETAEEAPAETIEPDAEAPETDEPDVDEPEAVKTEDASPLEGLVAIEHEVQQGQWLSRIASQYGVTTRELVEWNNLPSDNVRYGTRLKVYLPPERAAAITGEPLPTPQPAPADDAADDTDLDDGETDAAVDDDAGNDDTADAAALPHAPDPAAQPPGSRAIVHHVMPGETLTRLAQRYRVGTSNIIAWNELTVTNIRVGQELTIYVPEDAEFDE